MSIDYHEITGIIHCVTGLLIGGTDETKEIGGIDKSTICHPISGLPYIPGSSLKGKIRCLLELEKNVDITSGRHNCSQKHCDICTNFGSSNSHSITRFIFRDCYLTRAWEEKFTTTLQGRSINLLEKKSEVTIDRRNGRAVARVGPRKFERVPAGTEFDFAMTIRSLKEDDPDEQANLILQGIKLLEQDYLGSSGSRGYGQVEFRDLKIDGKPLR